MSSNLIFTLGNNLQAWQYNGNSFEKISSLEVNGDKVVASSQHNRVAVSLRNDPEAQLGVYRIVADCKDVPNAVGGVNGACICREGYNWQSPSCYIDCSKIANTDLTSASSLSSCPCAAGYIWSASEGKCNFDCSLYKYTNGGANGVCNCKVGATWNPTTRQCDVDCAKINKAAVNDGNQQCSC